VTIGVASFKHVMTFCGGLPENNFNKDRSFLVLLRFNSHWEAEDIPEGIEA